MTDEPARVLVVEDNPILRMHLVEALGDAGYDILEAADGLEAMMLARDPDHVSLILTDLNMPGVDGAAVVRYAQEHYPEVPVILMSGVSQMGGRLPVPSRFIAKPFTMEQLMSLVAAMLREKEAGPGG